MPKIRDLGVSHIPFARATETDPDAPHYWMCDPSTPNPEGGEYEKCHPTAPQCHPTNQQPKPQPQPGCNPTNPPDDQKDQQKALGIPADAVLQLRQDLRQQIGNQLQS